MQNRSPSQQGFLSDTNTSSAAAAAVSSSSDANAADVTASSPPLLALPGIVEEKIYASLPVKVLGLFAQVSHQAEAGTAFLRLLSSAVDAEPESYTQTDETKLAAIAILQRYPELLFECRGGRVTDHYGRKIIKVSPYRLLLGAGDTWALKQVHESILPSIEGGKTLAEAEFKAQFPSCPWPPTQDMHEEMFYDNRNKVQIAAVKTQLQIIVAKITADPCTDGQATLDETKKAVADLCQIFAPKEGEVIQTGLHFPLGIMEQILRVYAAQFNPWNNDQLAFFSFNVVGSAIAALTAVDGQCCKYGLANLNMAKGPDRRDGLFCRHPKGIPPALTPLTGKLGNTMFIDPIIGYSCFRASYSGYFDWYNKRGGSELGTRGGLWVTDGMRTSFAARMAQRIGQLMKNKSKDYRELLCGSTKRSQHVVSLDMTVRGNT